MIITIEDERHAEPQGEFSCIQHAIAELKRRADIPWDQNPNLAPCMNWETCGRAYEVVEYDNSQTPQTATLCCLKCSASGVKWAYDFEDVTTNRHKPNLGQYRYFKSLQPHRLSSKYQSARTSL